MVHVLYPLDNLNEQTRTSFPVLGFITTLPPSMFLMGRYIIYPALLILPLHIP
jgi:hypothetical protein